MITIIADPHGYWAAPPDALRAQRSADYVPVRIAIRRALDQGQTLTVYVADRLLLHWLDDLATYEGVRWEQLVPEADFRRLFGIEPAPPFSAELLVAVEIATLEAPPAGVAIDPAGWILRARLGELWAVPEGSAAHLGRLLRWVLQDGEPASALLPLVQHCLAGWASAEPAYAELRPGSLAADATRLIRGAALGRYEQTWLQGRGLAGEPLNLASLAPAQWVAALAELAPAIEGYWRERLLQAPPDAGTLRGAIAQMSGWSLAELVVVTQLLHAHPAMLDRSLLGAVRQRFEQLPEAAPALAKLDALIAPPPPALPDSAWDDGAWLRWATDSYMPYFAWTVRWQQPREHQIVCAQEYEQWLAARYPAWISSSGSPLITRQFTMLRDLLAAEPDALVVWLVIDGFAWWQGPLLHEACRQHGLHLRRHEPGVALLPSLTYISKRALVTGVPHTQQPCRSIAQAAQATLERAGVRACVARDEREAVAALSDGTRPHCLLFFANTLDTLAHDRLDFPDDDLVRGYLDKLGRTLGELRTRCTSQGRPFYVLVGSDHGSTMLPQNASQRRLPPAAREVIDVWDEASDQPAAAATAARAAVIHDPQQVRHDGDEWHLLDKVAFQLPQDHLVTRGYGYIGRRPTGWTHGGLTPEETIVPLMQFSPEPLVLQPLSVSITGQVRSRQEGALTLRLVNPNPAPLTSALIRIADLPPLLIEQIPAIGRVERTVTLPPRQIDGATLPLPWWLEGRVLGVPHAQQGEALVPVRRLQTESSLDDLFG